MLKLFSRILAGFIPSKRLRHSFREFIDDKYINPIYSSLDMFLKNPKVYQPAVGYLRDIQLASIKILCEVDRICREFDIKYFISFGSLLGAVRHGGFIPWDDDIDISMQRDDYKKFVDIFNKNTVFKNLRAEFCRSHLKVCLSGTLVTLDIFSFDVLNKNMDLNDKICFSRKLNSLSKNKLLKSVSKNAYNIEAEKLTKNVFGSDLCKAKQNSSIFYSIEFEHKHKIIAFDYSTIFPLKMVNFEGSKFFAPKNIDEYLTFIYGDYMNMPEKIKLHLNLKKIDLFQIMKIKEFLR